MTINSASLMRSIRCLKLLIVFLLLCQAVNPRPRRRRGVLKRPPPNGERFAARDVGGRGTGEGDFQPTVETDSRGRISGSRPWHTYAVCAGLLRYATRDVSTDTSLRFAHAPVVGVGGFC